MGDPYNKWILPAIQGRYRVARCRRHTADVVWAETPGGRRQALPAPAAVTTSVQRLEGARRCDDAIADGRRRAAQARKLTRRLSILTPGIAAIDRGHQHTCTRTLLSIRARRETG